MSNEMKLLPCPFCGGKTIFNVITINSSNCSVGFTFEILCNDCRIKLPKKYEVELSMGEHGEIKTSKDERKEALEAWNSRV